jgi:phospholipid/cholesterol/gamma-HCH transport system substrate-binding protein
MAAFTSVALAVVTVLAVVVLGGSTHTLNLRFIDAGQLVKGDLVEVAGRSVGSVDAITLTDDNQANVKVKIKGDDFWPLRSGTVAGIRAVGLSGVANRYVEVTPGPASGTPIADGGVIHTTRTRPIVDLDQVLTALDAPTRRRLQRLIKNGSTIFDGNAQDANDALTYLNPAVAQSHALLSELDRDTAAVGRLVSTSAAVSATLAGRRTDLQGSITNTARTLEAIAAQRTALQDALSRAPAFLREAGRTLENSSQTFRSVKPVLRELRPAAAPLAAVLRQLPGVGRAARPAVGQLRNLLPALRAALLAVPSLDRAARPALASTTSALASALPIAAGLRPYAPDVIAGLFNGFTGTTGGYYDANGHYARIQLVTGVAALSGTLSPLAAGQLQTGLSARCPGAAVEPADDKTNPNPEDPSVCDTGQNKK